MKDLFHLIGILNKNYGNNCSNLVLSYWLKNEIKTKEKELNYMKLVLDEIDNKRTKITKSWKMSNEPV